MAVSSWMLRNRNIRSSKFGKSKQKEEDVIKLNLKLDPHLNAVEILSMLSKTKDVTDAKRLNYLNNFVKLSMHLERNLEPLGFSIEEILYCLRFSLVSNLTQVRSGAFRAIRYVLSNESDVHCFNKLLIPLMVVRSLDLAIKYDIERIEAIKLIRRVLLIAPKLFDKVLARCLVSLANGGVEEKDRLLRVCLAALSELGILNSDLFIECGGVSAITRNLLECQTPRIAESLCGVLLLLLDRPITRDKAVVDLHCVAAPYCDFHYRHGWMDKNRDERELRFNCSRLALLSILRSWPGILHFCSPSDTSGLKAIVAILYLNQLEVRKAVLDLLYELLNLPQPEWTDELSVALSAIDPAEPQASWRLAEGFIVAEGRSVLPHLARTTPSISDMHLSILLYCFIETGLLEALAEVIATADTFICVRATVLLGELLRLIQLFLPPECCNITPALPNLLGYATKDKPQALAAVTGLQQLHKMLKRRPASYSLYMDYILRSGNFIKSSNRTEQIRKSKMRQVRSKISQLVMKDGDDVIKETGVLINKDAYTWNWNVIKMILKGETEHELSASDANDRSFLKRLVDYYTPSSYRYSHMDLTSPKNSQGYTMVGLELIECLLALNESFFNKLLLEWFENILSNIKSITTSKSAHDCLFSPQHMSNTQCQTYFLFIGRLGSKPAGEQILLNLSFFQVLQDLATTTNHDCYAKLIVSSLDYQNNKKSTDLLTKVLTCSIESSRLYATQFLLILLRAGIENFSSWGIKLLAGQLNDQSRSVYLSALASLHEACEVPVYLEELVKVNPDLLHLGEKGMLLLIRFLSVPNGFATLKKNNNFALHELQRWDEYFNYRYVLLIEGEISDALTLHQRGEDGRYDKRSSLLRSSSRKDLFLPPHIYGQLAKHSEGFQLLCDYGSLSTMVPCVNNGLCETEEEILNLKAALWVVGHLGSSVRGVEFLNSKNCLAGIVNLAKNCLVYSIRATALYSLGLIATTKPGADYLFKLGWVCTRHDRHDRWPIIEEENWAEDVPDSAATNRPTSESDRSDLAFSSDMFIADMDSSDTDLDMFLMDSSFQGKSQTLPNQNVSSSYHKRSLSESKTFEMWRGYLDKKSDSHLSTDSHLPQRYRDNSVTESTTSGVSSCESVLGKGILNENRLQTLSPIPSSSSLITIKTPVIKIRRHSESSRRVSTNSMTPSDKSTISPCGSSVGKLSHQDLIGYATLRSIRRNQQQNVEDLNEASFQNSNFLRVHSLDRQRKHPTSYTDCETGVFGNYLLGGLSLTSLSSVKKYSVKDSSKKQGSCYMGISLPISLSSLFPENDDYSLMFSKYATTENVEEELEVDSDDSEENCRISKSTKHNLKYCLRCSYDSLTRKKKKCKKGIVQEFKESDDNTLKLRENVLEHVEMLANPVAYKQSRQVLLNMKQKNPTIFHDICLYSEVCKMVSETSYRLVSRRFVQDIFFDVNFDVFTRDLELIFITSRATAVPKVRNTVNIEKKIKYTEIAKEKRKMELSGVAPKNVVVGFHVDEPPEMASSYVKYEPRSPPLSSVKEENVVSSTENLPNKNSSVHKQISITDKTESKSLPSAIKTLDQLKLTYNENKFPIKTRDDKTIIN